MKPLNISDNIKTLSDQIESEINRLGEESLTQASSKTDTVLYLGNWQDAIPRSIWIEPNLTAIDVRSWGVIRTQAIQGSAVVFSLNQLLKETLGYSKATISRVIYSLRLTRWISMCSTLRTEQGQFRGHIYAIHDTPVSLDDAIYLDRNYLAFVQKQTEHNNEIIQKLAQTLWQDIESHMENNHWNEPNSSVTLILDELVHVSEGKRRTRYAQHIPFQSTESQVQKLNPVKSDPVQKVNPAEIPEKPQVQKLNLDTLCSSRTNKTTTTENMRSSIDSELIFPEKFNDNEKKLALYSLKKVETELRQHFLDETAELIKQRSQTPQPIRNPIGYLSWLCQEHAKGHTRLTSAYLQHQEKRNKDQVIKETIQKKQNEMTQAARETGDIKACVIEKSGQNHQKKNTNQNRWQGLTTSIQPHTE